MSLHRPPAIPLSRPPHTFLASEPLWDSRCDVTDVWIEEMDPRNEDGAIATAYFRHERDHGDTNVTLIGLGVEEDGQTLFYTAAAAMDRLGWEATCRIEIAHFQEVNE